MAEGTPEIVGDSLRGQTGVPRREDGTPLIDNNENMAPFRARGLYTDLGEYRRMMNNDGTTFGWFVWLTRTILRAKWVLDRPKNPSSIESEMFELTLDYFGMDEDSHVFNANAMLYGGFPRLIMHGCECFSNGFSPNEISWSPRIWKGKAVLVPDRVEHRHPSSLNRWIYEQNVLVGIEQVVQAETGEGWGGEFTRRGLQSAEKEFIEIPIEKILMFQHLALDGNPEGRSLLRAAWPWYKAKMDTTLRDQRGQDRLIDGMTIFRELAPDEGGFGTLTEEDIDAAIDLYMDWHDGDVPFFYQPRGIGVEHSWPAWEAPPPTERVEYYDNQILMSIGAPVLGVLAGEARARDFEEVAKAMYASVQSMADSLANTINGIPGIPWTGLIPKLCDANFPTEDDTRYPQIRAAGVSFQDVERMVKVLALAEQFLLYTPTAEDEFLFREGVGLKRTPIEELEKRREEMRERAAGGQSSQKGTQGSQGTQATPESVRSGGSGDESEEEEGEDDDS